MEMFSQFIRTFLCGGILCLIGQILIDKTSLTPAKILTLYVVGGVVLGAVGVYEPIAKWGGAGATVPLTGLRLRAGKRSAPGCRQRWIPGGNDRRYHRRSRRDHCRYFLWLAGGIALQPT